MPAALEIKKRMGQSSVTCWSLDRSIGEGLCETEKSEKEKVCGAFYVAKGLLQHGITSGCQLPGLDRWWSVRSTRFLLWTLVGGWGGHLTLPIWSKAG